MSSVEDRSIPLIIRIGGIPASAVAPFRSDLASFLDTLDELHESLASARTHLIDRLYTAIHDADPEQRRFLLKVKRDSFNGRPLRPLQEAAGWPLALQAAGAEIAAVLAQEESAAAAEAAYRDAHSAEVERQRLALVAVAQDERLYRGITLSTLVVAEQQERLTRKKPSEWGRRERRLETALLRFATRAALKLSPFGSLTRIALARVTDGPASGLRFTSPDRCAERSLARLRRYLVEQYADLLIRHEKIRLNQQVVLNDSLEKSAENRYRYLSSGHWSVREGANHLQYTQPALVRVTLSGKLIEWLFENLERRPIVYRDLLTAVDQVFEGADPAVLRSTLERLIDVDFLTMILPAKSSDLVLEKSLHDHLAAHYADDPELAPIQNLLGEVLVLLESFHHHPVPVAAVRHGQVLVDRLWEHVAPLAGINPQEISYRTLVADQQFFEDVLLEDIEEPNSCVLHLPRERARELLDQISPIVRLSNLHNFRFDLLQTLAAFAEAHWPGKSEVGFFDFFEGAQKLFQSFLSWEVEERLYRSLERVVAFNPLEIASVAELRRCREEVAAQFPHCLQEQEDHLLVCDSAALTTLLDQLGSPAATVRDVAAFMQPLDPEGRKWVLNDLFEGLGRMSSRYSAVLGANARNWWTRSFVDCSDHLDDEGEPAEWVDLYCPAGHVINVHAAQTRRVLEIPAFSSGLPRDRVLRLSDVRVLLGGREPRLVDGNGRRIVPLHLGGLVFRFTPNLFKFLSLFSSAEFRARKPILRKPAVDGVERLARHQIGDIVYVRRAWLVQAQFLPQVADLNATQAYSAIHSWRKKMGIPHQVFVLAPLANVEVPDLKPQFLDFTSPLMVELFRTILQIPIPVLRFTEALPSPEEMMPGGREESWALEVQLDSIGI